MFFNFNFEFFDTLLWRRCVENCKEDGNVPEEGSAKHEAQLPFFLKLQTVKFLQ